MLNDLNRVVIAIRSASEAGFRLAKAIRCATFWGHGERENLLRVMPDEINAFCKAWDEAGKVAFSPSGLRVPGDSSCHAENNAVLTGISYAMVNIKGELIGLDPRRYLAATNPAKVDIIKSADIEDISGKLGHIAEYITRESNKLRETLTANRGEDADEALRSMAEKEGASPQRLAESAREFLAPSGKLTVQARRQATATAGKLRQRTFRARPLPGAAYKPK